MEFIELLEKEIEEGLNDSRMRVVVFEDENDFTARIIMPMEFMITYGVSKDDMVYMKMGEAAGKIARFKDMYMDGALQPDIGEAFLDLPGIFSFVTDQIDIRAKRLIGIIIHDLYGKHNIYAINVHEENIRVDTRGGRFYFKYNDFNVSVKKELELIDRIMRKPLRKRFKI